MLVWVSGPGMIHFPITRVRPIQTIQLSNAASVIPAMQATFVDPVPTAAATLAIRTTRIALAVLVESASTSS